MKDKIIGGILTAAAVALFWFAWHSVSHEAAEAIVQEAGGPFTSTSAFDAHVVDRTVRDGAIAKAITQQEYNFLTREIADVSLRLNEPDLNPETRGRLTERLAILKEQKEQAQNQLNSP